ncbi:uncharacterized protein [Antedon mediterranea]|uniref:uncharacterized protein n=1 Tax=Antedon mediterranea TaxID=105859 RepID=UPI003AF41801
MVHGPWFMVHGSWLVYGSWFMVRCWFMVHGSWFIVGSWFMCVIGLVIFSRDVSGEAVSFSLNDAAPSAAGGSAIIAPRCRLSTTATLSQKRIVNDFGSVLKAGGEAVEDVDADDDDSVVLASTFNSHLSAAGVGSVSFDSKMPTTNVQTSSGGGGGAGGVVGGSATDYIPDFAPYPYPGPIFSGYCRSFRTTIQPTWAINSQHQWVRVFQAYYFRQTFPVVYCTSAYCNSFYAYPFGLDTPGTGGGAEGVGGPVGTSYYPQYYFPFGRCYVKYRYFYALVVAGCGGGYPYWGGLNLQVQLIRLPGSCSCRNDFIWPPIYKK